MKLKPAHLLLILFVFVAPLGLAGQQKSSFTVINVMDDFWKYWEVAEKADLPTQTRLFRRMVMEPHKEIYAGFTGNLTDDQLAPYFKAIPRFAPRMRALTQNLTKRLDECSADFNKTFPDMKWNGTVLLYPNFGRTDSGLGTIGKTEYLFFGIDTLAIDRYSDTDLLVLISHDELFHMYHGQFQPDSAGKTREKGEVPLYLLIWGEGLASYASEKLNKDATGKQVFLNNDTEKIDQRKLAELSKAILKDFDNGSPDVWRPYLAANKIDPNIPPRAGYYVGYKIAEKLGRRRSLKQLAMLKGEDLRKAVKSGLSDLARQSQLPRA